MTIAIPVFPCTYFVSCGHMPFLADEILHNDYKVIYTIVSICPTELKFAIVSLWPFRKRGRESRATTRP
jgi:hypothetical protein